MNKYIRNFFNGLAFGITETVPGVSGGTIAIIFGFYDELIRTVNHFTDDYRKSFKFFVPLLLGIATGLLTFASIINFLLSYYSFPTMVFFIGLVVGIIPHIYVKVKEPGRNFNPKEIAMIIVPILFLIIISNIKSISITKPAEEINNIDIPFMLFILLSGILAAAALVIPGISGSFVLLLIGIYPLVTYSLSSIRFILTDITNISLILSILKVLAPLGIGIIIGGLSMARLIEKLLNNYYKIVYSIILGLLIGSVYALFNEKIVFQSGISAPLIIAGSLTFITGCLISFLLGKKRL